MTPPQTMPPLSACTPEQLSKVRLVLTDIDDTLTLDGRLPASAYSAMENPGSHGYPGYSDNRASGRLGVT